MFLLFFLFWVIFNGQLTVEIGLLGLVIAGLIYAFICRFMDWSIKKEVRMLHFFLFMLGYMVVLIKEILKANAATIKMIFSEKYEMEPVLVTFRTKLKSPILRVLLANSITLTPGTITVSVEDDLFTVHALDKDFVDGIEKCIFVKLLEKAERKGGKNG